MIVRCTVALSCEHVPHTQTMESISAGILDVLRAHGMTIWLEPTDRALVHWEVMPRDSVVKYDYDGL